MNRRHFRTSMLALSIGLGGVTAGSAWAQEVEGHPDGGRWPAPQYEKPSTATRLPMAMFDAMRPSAVGFGAAAVVESELPPEINLQRGIATQVMGGIASAGAAPDRTSRTPAPMEDIDPEQAGEMMDSSAEPGAAVGGSGDSQKWFITYPLDYQGVPLAKYSNVLSVVGADGQVHYVRKSNLPTAVDATTPDVSADAAIDAARAHAAEATAALEVEVDTPVLEIWVDPELNGRLTWKIALSADGAEEPVARRYWIAAVHEPEVVHWENLVHSTHHGEVTGTRWTATPFGPTQNQRLSNLEVSRSLGDTETTAEDGLYAFASGAGNATIEAALAGPRVVVHNDAGTAMAVSGSGTPADAVDLHFAAAAEFEFAQVTAFHWVNEAYRFARNILDPLPGSPFASLPARVNRPGSCNAFWTGSSLLFRRAGGSCPNMAYAGVVMHEYGHGIDDWRGGILDGGLSEGTGDAIALLTTRQSCVGRDFFGAGTCLREATDVDLWPPSPFEGSHARGKRYAQFTWQIVQELRKSHSEEESFQIAKELTLAAIAGNPVSIPDAVMLTFIADDDDGDLGNGTPHFVELAAAADSRNLPRPADPPVATGDRLAFAWANDPTSSDYIPSATYSHNSSGGAVHITRSGTGRYRVEFVGMGGAGHAGGHVQVTAYGSGSEACKVASWGSSGADFIANVRCFDAGGSLVDTRYTVLIFGPEAVLTTLAAIN